MTDRIHKRCGRPVWACDCFYDRTPRLTDAEQLIENTRALRRALGLFDGAMPISPKEAWEEALAAVEALVKRARP